MSEPTAAACELQNHPAADVWPMMDDKQYSELLQDIHAHGQQQPITLCEGKILDGRNRYRACLELGIAPKTETYSGNPFSQAWSLNGPRRDVEAVRKGVILILLQEKSKEWDKRNGIIKAEGNRKRSEAAKGNNNAAKGRQKTVVDHSDPPPSFPKKHVAREARAAEAKVSTGTMARSERIAKDKKLAKKVVDGEIKAADALRELKKRDRLKKLQEAAHAAALSAFGHDDARPQWSILNVDVMVGLESVRDEHGPARMIFTDPPYNIGIDYGDGKKADLLSPQAYMKWVRQWLGLCWDCLTDDGSLWVMIGDEYAAEYCTEIKAIGFTVRSWIKWYETFGVNCSNKFNRTSRHIFYAVKDDKSFVFNPDPVTRPSDRQTKYGDTRAAAGGKLWDDVWQIPRLTGLGKQGPDGFNERIPDFPTQLPLALVEPIVLCASMPGDLVVDPFNGSGTTGVASIRNGRKYVGIEKSEKFADIADLRLKATGGLK